MKSSIGVKPYYLKTKIAVLVLLTLGCKNSSDISDPNVIVRVYDNVLTKTEISHIVKSSNKGIDSAEIADRYIQEWVNKELILEKAKINIGDRAEIEQMVSEYRNSLLVSKYLELLVAQKANVTIDAQEVAAYYNENTKLYVLDEDIVSGIYLKIPVEAPKLDLLKTWMTKRTEDDLIELEDYCFQNAQKYEVFIDKWLPLSVVSKYLPNNDFSKFKKGVTIEQADSLSLYYVLVFDKLDKGEPAPLMYVEPQILKVLQHKKRLEYLGLLKKDIFDEAVKTKKVEYYEK